MDHKKLKELQNIQYEMLKAVDVICKKHDIKYYLVYGTLLGAVRHKASIPWDYDIDIAMPREELNKFLKVQDELEKTLRLEHICYSTIEYAGLTRVIKPNVEGHGDVHIDIFVLDYAKNKSKLVFKLSSYFCTLLHMAKLSEFEKDIIEHTFSNQPLKKAVVKLSRIVNKLMHGSANVEKNIYNITVSNVPRENYIILEDIRKLLSKNAFEDIQMLQYEDSLYPCPADYDKLLKIWYGDYMQIPPEGQKYIEEENELRKSDS